VITTETMATVLPGDQAPVPGGGMGSDDG